MHGIKMFAIFTQNIVIETRIQERWWYSKMNMNKYGYKTMTIDFLWEK